MDLHESPGNCIRGPFPLDLPIADEFEMCLRDIDSIGEVLTNSFFTDVAIGGQGPATERFDGSR